MSLTNNLRRHFARHTAGCAFIDTFVKVTETYFSNRDVAYAVIRLHRYMGHIYGLLQASKQVYGTTVLFLLFARYVPRGVNVSMYILTTDRPATDDRPLISKNSNGHISATDHPIHFMFGSRMGFSGTAELFLVRTNPR